MEKLFPALMINFPISPSQHSKPEFSLFTVLFLSVGKAGRRVRCLRDFLAQRKPKKTIKARFNSFTEIKTNPSQNNFVVHNLLDEKLLI